MNPFSARGRPTLLATVLGLAIWIAAARAQSATGDQSADGIRILELQGKVEISPAGATTWVLTQTNQVLHPSDKLRTGPNSRVTLRWSDQSVVSFGALTVMEILPPHEPGARNGLNLFSGLLSFFHRDEPERIRIITRGGTAGVRGTEFVVAVETNGTERTTLSVIDGTVQLSNPQGTLMVTNNQQALAELGKAPIRTAGFIANNVLQWCFYYPAVLDLRDLPLTAEEEQTLSESLLSYRSGDLLAALASYPAARQPSSDAERVYYAALLLSVGQIAETETALAALPVGNPSERLPRLSAALRQLIAAVKREPNPSTFNPRLSTEFLAASYYEQSRAVREESLRGALNLARQAATLSPQFGFAWARVAELEFSFGHTSRALDALNRSLELSPRNAQALALNGFLLAAQNKTREAIDWFDHAITVDSALGNAWLGRGLCRIRRGDASGGREDLLIAAALEPRRALLRSYLGKAYGNAGDTRRATHELDLAKSLDPADPTAWLYSALLSQQNNRVNEGIRDLEKSQELNDNRALFRSRLLLDQDRAIRSASLAKIYQSAGLDDVALREAARAVSEDYASHSAHQFLAESFNSLRDPARFNLRYEIVWFNELLLANLLSPVGAGLLSQNLSQQEYSRLFEASGLGLVNSTEVRSDGQIREIASQYGLFGKTSYALDLDYQHNNGIRPNNDLDRLEWYTQFKQQLSGRDSFFALMEYVDYAAGDNFQHYDPADASRKFRITETQTPIAVGALHREWGPGIHTTLMGGRLESDQTVLSRWSVFELRTNSSGVLTSVPSRNFDDLDYENRFTALTGEANQVVQTDRQVLVVGGRFQSGEFDTSSSLNQLVDDNGVILTNLIPVYQPPVRSRISESFRRVSLYAYESWRVLKRFQLTAGLTYDHLSYPANFRFPPVTPGQQSREKLSPKAAFQWDIGPGVTMRGIYSQSLGGVTFDETFRLEPAQLAGFSQAFRSVISEAEVGSVAAPRYELGGVALDVKLPTRTYLGAQAQLLKSAVDQNIGIFWRAPTTEVFPGTTPEHLDYTEKSLAVTLNQLLGRDWSFGAAYSYTDSRLDWTYPGMTVAVGNPTRSEGANLHRVSLRLLWNHPSGFFARAESQWFIQDNVGYPNVIHNRSRPGESLNQVNLFVGWRFLHRRGELTFGCLNVTDQDYRLNSLTPYSDLPRDRVWTTRLRFNF